MTHTRHRTHNKGLVIFLVVKEPKTNCICSYLTFLHQPRFYFAVLPGPGENFIYYLEATMLPNLIKSDPNGVQNPFFENPS